MEIAKKGGSMRFWGEWFGRPYDNFHKPLSAEFNGGVLTIRFDGGEQCTVYDPSVIVNEPNDFHVERASKIAWEWYYYGKERAPENLCRWEFTLIDNAVSLKCSGTSQKCASNADPREYALQMC